MVMKHIIVLIAITLYFAVESGLQLSPPGHCQLSLEDKYKAGNFCEGIGLFNNTNQSSFCSFRLDNITNCGICFNCSRHHGTQENITCSLLNNTLCFRHSNSTPPTVTSLPTTAVATTDQEPTVCEMSINTSEITLGIVVALLVTTVITLATGWICTCLVMKQCLLNLHRRKHPNNSISELSSHPAACNDYSCSEYEVIPATSRDEQQVVQSSNEQSRLPGNHDPKNHNYYLLEPSQLSDRDKNKSGETSGEVVEISTDGVSQGVKHHHYYLLEPGQFVGQEDEVVEQSGHSKEVGGTVEDRENGNQEEKSTGDLANNGVPTLDCGPNAAYDGVPTLDCGPNAAYDGIPTLDCGPNAAYDGAPTLDCGPK